MRVVIPLQIWQHIQGYAVAAAPNEVTGFGTIQQVDNDFVVDEIFVPEQKSNSTFCETAEGAINDIIFNLIEDNPARAGALRFRWHSHVNGAVYWSPTDEADIAEWKAPWVVNLVVNVFGEKTARLDVFTDEIKLENIALDVHIQMPTPAIPPDVQQACVTEVNKKVSFLPPRDFKQQLVQLQKNALEYPLLMKGGDKGEPKV